ncbi:Pentatricopeptide repeat [Dillenia turbinata]|uniref:Pentatricopeptide repeat n=1 Tax=Dillenia turbinata TaxID=194707 RepID=A0AAN8W2B8_9MAGN
MLAENVVPNEPTLAAALRACTSDGISDRALQLFKNMQLDGLKPDHVTVTSLLSASGSVGALLLGQQRHSHVGLVNEGLNYFNSMSKEHGLVPKPEHNVCVVDVLGRAGDLDRAQKFIDEMPIETDAMPAA